MSETEAPRVARITTRPTHTNEPSAPGAQDVDAFERASDPIDLEETDPVSSEHPPRSGRIRKWDREPLPHDWRFYVGNFGKTLIAVGLLMFGFVGYQLYGTGIETAAAQSELEDQFEDQLTRVEPVPADTSATPDDVAVDDTPPEDGSAEVATQDSQDPTATEPDVAEPDVAEPNAETAPSVVPVEVQNIPNDLENGDAIAKIEIPRIGVDDIIVAGVETADLKRGPGHFPDTPLPGQLGNAAIAGHRTTYGQPFRNVDQLQNGDEIKVTTLTGVYVYRVTGQTIVEPSEYEVVATTDPTAANLTLTSCHPVFTAQQRIVIFSELDRTESAPVGEPVINYGRTVVADTPQEIPGDPDLATGDDPVDTGVAGQDEVESTIDPSITDSGVTTGSLTDGTSSASQLGSEAVNEGIADAFSDGWFSDPGANPHVGIWGVALGAIAIAAYALSRRFRRDLVGLAVGLLPFALALYFFFQNVNRLLPPHL